MRNFEQWHDFTAGNWTENLDIKNFIQVNYQPYEGSAEFLAGPTKRTTALYKKYETLRQAEIANNGVLDVDTKTVSSLLTFAPGYLDKEKELIVGLQTDAPLKRAINPFGGIRMAKAACEAYGYKMDPKIEKEFEFRTTHNEGVFRAYTEEMKIARKSGIITGLPDAYGRGRIIGDYRRVALYGIDVLVDEKKKDYVELGEKLMSDDNIQLIEEVYRQIDFLHKLKDMAKMYGCDISAPASNAKEAIQWTYFAYLAAIKEQNGAAMSLGRVSTFLDVYIERDFKRGILTEETAQELMDDFVLKLRMVRQLRTVDYNELFAGDPNWVTESIGGMGLDGRTLVTKNSYRVLQTLYNLNPAPEPNLTVLWSTKLPEDFKNYCAQISIDTDSVQYENDDMMRTDYGDDYGIACCVSAMKIGEQMQYFGARCNLPKILLLALNGGKEETHGYVMGPQMPAVDESPLVYEDVVERFKLYQGWLVKLYVNTMNVIHYMHDKYAYEKTQMALHNTEVERLMAFGIAGLSVITDSLSAIKYAKVTPIKNEQGIIVDFKVEGEFPMYGNNDDRVDQIAVQMTKDFYEELVKYPTHRKAVHTLSVLTITSNVVYGKKTGATPDGRKAGAPFAPGANPMHYRDIHGALASLNSVAKIPYACCKDGVSNTFSIQPDTLGKEAVRKSNLAAILDGYFEQSGHHLNINVFQRENLIEAMNNPDLFPNLTVRVSGYAVNFNRLSREQQEEVIARTYHKSL